jgi:hypothetical protein
VGHGAEIAALREDLQRSVTSALQALKAASYPGGELRRIQVRTTTLFGNPRYSSTEMASWPVFRRDHWTTYTGSHRLTYWLTSDGRLVETGQPATPGANGSSGDYAATVEEFMANDEHAVTTAVLRGVIDGIDGLVSR